jgi:hypothetical protein
MINVKNEVLPRDRKPVLKAMWGKTLCVRCSAIYDLRNSDKVGDAQG